MCKNQCVLTCLRYIENIPTFQSLLLSKLWKKLPSLLLRLPWWGGKMVCFWTHVLWEPVHGEGGRRCQEVAVREGVMFMYERWGWVLVFSLRRSSSPTFPIFFGFSLKIGLLSLIFLSNYIVISRINLYVFASYVWEKGVSVRMSFCSLVLKVCEEQCFVYCMCLLGWVRIVLKMFFFWWKYRVYFWWSVLGIGMKVFRWREMFVIFFLDSYLCPCAILDWLGLGCWNGGEKVLG